MPWHECTRAEYDRSPLAESHKPNRGGTSEHYIKFEGNQARREVRFMREVRDDGVRYWRFDRAE